MQSESGRVNWKASRATSGAAYLAEVDHVLSDGSWSGEFFRDVNVTCQ